MSNLGPKMALSASKIDYIFYRIKFSHEILNNDIPDILYTLSDHPPISFSINTK